jgi:hypothetical protein
LVSVLQRSGQQAPAPADNAIAALDEVIEGLESMIENDFDESLDTAAWICHHMPGRASRALPCPAGVSLRRWARCF